MESWIEWLLDLEHIRLRRDAPLVLQWDSPVEGWVWFGFALFALGVFALVYRRERTTASRRIVLAVLRCSIAGLVAIVLCRPSLVLQRNRVEPSSVALVVDTSRSMAAQDDYRDKELAQAVSRGAGLDDPSELANKSRLELVRSALGAGDADPLRTLLKHNDLQLCTFASQVEALGVFSKDSPAALDDLIRALDATVADGSGTDLASAISGVILKSEGRRLAAIVLASDGRTTASTSLKDAIDLAKDRRIPIYPVLVGSPETIWDISIAPLRTQDGVFMNDIIAIDARIISRGLTKPVAATVRLVHEGTGRQVASEEIQLDPGRESVSVELRTKATASGRQRYRVEVSALPGEASVENNAERVDITVLDNRLHVLYVDSYPRYEYRYLKNALLREQTVELSVLLIEADERFVQEGTDPIRRFPETPEELSRYDVVIFGDVDPRSGWITLAQMNMLLNFVGNEGGGFGLIAGERAAPHLFAGTPLQKLLPVRIDPSFFGRYDASLSDGFQARLTPEGARSRMLRFAADRDQNQSMIDELPELFWIARTLGPTPGASVLLAHPTLRTDTGAMPLVVTGRYGAGRLLFQATDDTWRWRRHTGELLHDSYWVQAVRALMPDVRGAQDRRFALRTDRRLYPYGSTVITQIEVFDTRLLADLRESLRVAVAESASDVSVKPGDSNSALKEVESQSAAARNPVDEIVLHRVGPESNLFEGVWVPPGPGGFILEASQIEAGLGERRVSVLVRVDVPNLETRHIEADHDALGRLAAQTGGKVAGLDQLSEVFATIRDRSVQIPDDVVEPLWDSKLALALFALMISMEWVLRKWFGLV